VVNTAEGALGEVSALLLEVQGLTNEAANTGALSQQEIQANQLQVDAILNSINRIANTTQFNGVKLLNGSLDYTTSGVDADAIDIIQVNAAKLPDNGSVNITVQVTNSAEVGTLTFAASGIGATPTTIEVAGNRRQRAAVVRRECPQQRDRGGDQPAQGVDRRERVGHRRRRPGALLDAVRVQAVRQREDAQRLVHGRQGLRRQRRRQHQRQPGEVDGLVASVRTGELDVTLTLDQAFAQTTTPPGSQTSFRSPAAGRSSNSARRSTGRARCTSASTP
jgi:flagellin-like hook-associated protein FlgL